MSNQVAVAVALVAWLGGSAVIFLVARFAVEPISEKSMKVGIFVGSLPLGVAGYLALEMVNPPKIRVGLGLGLAVLGAFAVFKVVEMIRPRVSFLALVEAQRDDDRLFFGERHAPTGQAFNPQLVALPMRGQCGNIHILGAIGSGKTASTILPLAEQIFAKHRENSERWPGAVFLDIKGGMAKKLKAIARRYGRESDVVVIRPGGGETFNIVGDATPEVAAQRLNDALFAINDGPVHPFYRDAQLTFLRGAFEALDTRYGRAQYTVEDLYRFISDEKVFKDVLTQIGDDASEGVRYLKRVKAQLGPRDAQKLTVGLTNALQLWVGPAFRATFCVTSPSFRGFTDLIHTGKIAVVELPEDQFNASLCRSVALVILSSFMDAALARTNEQDHPNLNRERLVYLFVDEAHTVMSKHFERFTAVSRQAMCPVIIAHQQIGQIPIDYRNGIAGNFRTHLTLAVNDAETADFFEKHFGQKKTQRVSRSHSKSRGRAAMYSQGESKTEVEEPRFSSTELRELPQWQAIVSIFDGECRHPPVRITTFPHFQHVTEEDAV